MTGPELGVWLLLGLILAAPFLLVLPVRGGHGQHAHAGPGTLTVDYLRNDRIPQGERTVLALTPPKRSVHHTDDAIIWPPEPTPLEHNLARLCAHPDGEYVGRHRLGEAYELYLPPPGWHLELTPHAPAPAAT